MKIREFSFDLPEELIAQHPPKERGMSRLLCLNRATETILHTQVKQLADQIEPGTVMVFNNSRVRKARIYAVSPTGGKVEFLLLKQYSGLVWECMVSRSKRQRTGKVYEFPGGLKGTIVEEVGVHRMVEFSRPVDDEYMNQYGHLPLPPYIKREDSQQDQDRYQTVYARKTGSVAAPTAGLHFTDEILKSLTDKGVILEEITLHVGLGTFLPVRAENIEDHKMHNEEYEISQKTADTINQAKKEGRKILAVGTTSVRTLETAGVSGLLPAGRGSSELFITPGFEFKIIDQLFTNFHTPESTLLILVSAFAGKELIDRAYYEAVQERYRFFSYGDAMLIQ